MITKVWYLTNFEAHISCSQRHIAQLLIFSFRNNNREKNLTAKPASSRVLWTS